MSESSLPPLPSDDGSVRIAELRAHVQRGIAAYIAATSPTPTGHGLYLAQMLWSKTATPATIQRLLWVMHDMDQEIAHLRSLLDDGGMVSDHLEDQQEIDPTDPEDGV